MSLPIYVITLKRTPERTLYIQRQLDALNLDYQVVYGIDKYDLSSKEYRLKIASQLGISESDMEYKYMKSSNVKALDTREFGIREIDLGEFAVVLSHIKVYDLMVKNKDSKACILEDDIFLPPIFSKLLVNVQKFSWNMVLLSNQSESNASLIYALATSKSMSVLFEVLRKITKHSNRHTIHQYRVVSQFIFDIIKRYLSFYIGKIIFNSKQRLPSTKREKESIIFYYASKLGALPVSDKSSWSEVIDNHYIAEPSEFTSSAMAYIISLDTAIKYKELAISSSLTIDDIPWHLFVDEGIKFSIITPPCGYAEHRYLYYSPRHDITI